MKNEKKMIEVCQCGRVCRVKVNNVKKQNVDERESMIEVNSERCYGMGLDNDNEDDEGDEINVR